MKAKSNSGYLAAIAAYGIWGILPIYWKLLQKAPAYELLCHRIVWSFIFTACLLVLARRIPAFTGEVRRLAADRRLALGVGAAAVLISMNWLIYIWAVNSGQILESSLGYYINPLVSVALGVVFLREKLSLWQMVSCLLAAGGVLNMMIHFGRIPWVALLLAVSFALYGLCKKKVHLSPITSITLETLLVLPPALAYLLYLGQSGKGAFTPADPVMMILLISAGGITSVPLMLFSYGANHLPLKVLGFTQYLSPTIAMLLAIFLYKESFTAAHLTSFGLIWLALAIFSLAGTLPFRQMETKIKELLWVKA